MSKALWRLGNTCRLRPNRDRTGWVTRPIAPRSLVEQRVGAACYVQRKDIVRGGDARAAVARDLVGAVGAKRQETLAQIVGALHAAIVAQVAGVRRRACARDVARPR